MLSAPRQFWFPKGPQMGWPASMFEKKFKTLKLATRVEPAIDGAPGLGLSSSNFTLFSRNQAPTLFTTATTATRVTNRLPVAPVIESPVRME